MPGALPGGAQRAGGAPAPGGPAREPRDAPEALRRSATGLTEISEMYGSVYHFQSVQGNTQGIRPLHRQGWQPPLRRR